MNNKVKILWVTNAFGCGGAERQMLYMYDILKKYCDFDIRILYYAKVGDELPTERVNTIYVDKEKIGRVNTIRAIAQYIRENDISIMHAFGGCSANFYGRAGALFSRKTISVGAMLGQKHFVSLGSRVINSILNLGGNWWTVNNTELIPILKRDLKFISDEKIKMIHNGFVSDKEIDYQEGEYTEYDEDKKESFVFCAVGRLQPVKNYKLYIEAASVICKKYDDVKFWIIGNGSEYSNLNAQIKDLGIAEKVKLWGYRTDIDCALSRSDVFVQTSFTEGSPNTIAEAMRASKPIISTNSTDLSEMISEGENGFIVKNNDVAALVTAMEKMLLMSKVEQKEFGKVSHRMFEKFFLDRNVAKEFEEFYMHLLKK